MLASLSGRFNEIFLTLLRMLHRFARPTNPPCDEVNPCGGRDPSEASIMLSGHPERSAQPGEPAGSFSGGDLPETGGRIAAPAPPSAARRLWLTVLGAGLLAGLVAWGAGELTFGLYHWDDANDVIKVYKTELSKLGPYAKNEFIAGKMVEARARAESRNAAIALGTLGALLGLALGAAGGAVAGSMQSGIRGALIGLVMGGGFGFLAPFLVVPLYYKYNSPLSGLTVPLAEYAGLLLPIGAAAGLALGVGLGRRGAVLTGLLGALLGACVAVVVYEMGASLEYPNDQEPAPIPGHLDARLLIHLGLALFVASFAAIGVSARTRTPRGSR
jgi:hypothetical protein